ncbi:MAG: hypothetical protein Q8Q09_17730 [Deltaproteobacteria bacterium]|nr:hypothetical protein [Deltaproteobacteria bacterium]
MVDREPWRDVELLTPPLPCLVGEGVFDHFAWWPSTTITWRCHAPALVRNARSTDPTGMAFVFSREVLRIPAELARLHVGRASGVGEAMCLAPYAIDDATDELFEQRIEPRSVLWLIADNLDALFWGLHDWSHFHNHGSFEARAATELQCDLAALVWLSLNREVIGLDASDLDSLRDQAARAHEQLCLAQPHTHALPSRWLDTAADFNHLLAQLASPDGELR